MNVHYIEDIKIRLKDVTDDGEDNFAVKEVVDDFIKVNMPNVMTKVEGIKIFEVNNNNVTRNLRVVGNYRVV